VKTFSRGASGLITNRYPLFLLRPKRMQGKMVKSDKPKHDVRDKKSFCLQWKSRIGNNGCSKIYRRRPEERETPFLPLGSTWYSSQNFCLEGRLSESSCRTNNNKLVGGKSKIASANFSSESSITWWVINSYHVSVLAHAPYTL
jgi:hypothetical protein